MTRLTMVGITHRGAPLALLERVAVRKEDRPDRLSMLRTLGCSEAVLLSTCSRVEIYVGNASSGPKELLTSLLDLLAGHSRATLGDLRGVVEVRTGQAVVEHLFDVTAGLSSRVLGEVEILAQTRTAFREAAAAGMTGLVLGRLFPAALRSGRRVRAATSLGEYARSLAHQAVDVGLTSLAECPDPMVLVVGSGQMARAAVDHLAGRGIRASVAARDEAYAARLAGTGAVCPLPALTWGIAAADLLIDVAVAKVPRVTLIDLEGLSDDGTADPGLAAALSTGAGMARVAARGFAEGFAAREAGPVIAALRQRVEQICHDEVARTNSVGDLDPEALARSAHAIAGKLLHRPTIAARQAAAAGDVDALRQLCDMFGVPLAEVGLAEVGLAEVALVDVDRAEPGGRADRIAV